MINPFKLVKEFLQWRKIISTSENYIGFLRDKGVRVGENVTIYNREKITFDLTRPWLVEIGDNVEITAGATILTHGYDWCVMHKKTGEIIGSAGKVKIGNNIFVGVNTTILPNTHINDNVIIAAGSVVKGEIEENSVYGGVPAKKISSIDDYFEKRRALQLEEAVMMVLEYKKVYDKMPNEDVMHEHFWLFSNTLEGLNETFVDKLKLRGNYNLSSERFQKNKPPFKNYEEFLAYCVEQEPKL